ncbi:MAG: hypothetical protein U0R18_04280 [Mycobacterium sp.]
MSQLILASEALAGGAMTRRELQRRYQRVHQNVYAPRDLELTAADRVRAAWLWSGRTATASGLSAAVLLGSRWIPDETPAELLRTQYPAPRGIIVHQDQVPEEELTTRSGISCTTAERTVFDLGRRLAFTEGLVRVDALLNATNTAFADIAKVVDRHPGARYVRRLRDVLAVADGGAESPQETRVRLVLLRGGTPTVTTQIPVGRRRIDMGWPEWKVGVEYDGAQHWDDPRQHGSDIERLEYFDGLGWRIVRVVAAHLRDPHSIIGRAERALRSAGWTGTLTPSSIGLLPYRTGKMR